MRIETHLRQAIRDAVNRPSRKPFFWGGVAGYQQLEALAQAFRQGTRPAADSPYLRRLLGQVERVLSKNRSLATDVQAAHQGLRQIASCLRYPPKSGADGHRDGSPASETLLGSQEVAQEIETWLHQFQPSGKEPQAQTRLYHALQKRWKLYAQELLFCYDIAGLPQDNLQLESLFGRLRRHQRRISGRKSTRELRDFGPAQVLFLAESQAAVLRQIQQVSWAAYQQACQRLREAEAPRQFFRRLHRDPLGTAQALVEQHTARRKALSQQRASAEQTAQLELHTV